MSIYQKTIIVLALSIIPSVFSMDSSVDSVFEGGNQKITIPLQDTQNKEENKNTQLELPRKESIVSSPRGYSFGLYHCKVNPFYSEKDLEDDKLSIVKIDKMIADNNDIMRSIKNLYCGELITKNEYSLKEIEFSYFEEKALALKKKLA